MTTTRHSRSRTVLRYSAAALCAGLLALYSASQRWNFFAQTPPLAVEVMGGVVELHRGGAPSCSVTTHNWPWRHAFAFSVSGGYWQAKFPLYVPLAPVLALTAALWARPGGTRPPSRAPDRTSSREAAR